MSMNAAAAGLQMLPEWAPQQATWLSWPVDDPRHWGGKKRDAIWQKFAEIAAAISLHQPVRINAVVSDHDEILQFCNRAKAVMERVEGRVGCGSTRAQHAKYTCSAARLAVTRSAAAPYDW